MYDSVEWSVVEVILRKMNFPHQFIRWIMMTINGEYTNLLVAKKGLRQGDPLSPMIFVLVMEYLYRSLQRLKDIPDSNLHAKCDKLGIINLSFADDLLLFSRGYPGSVELLMQMFNKFVASTGLSGNPSKCKIYFGSVPQQDRDEIQKLTSFQVGILPFRYLGIPLTSKKLTVVQCSILVDKLVQRICHWSSRLLSLTGRL